MNAITNDFGPNLDLLRSVRADIAAEYAEPHEYPWIIGFSGGKDSTLVAHLVIEHLLSLPLSARTRSVYVVSNDTLVESPLVIAHVRTIMDEIKAAADAFALPVKIQITQPDDDQTFWVSLIGRGYPSPNRTFRWCTDRMKIQPTSRFIKKHVDAFGKVVLLLGVRRDESSTRAGSVAKYDNGERLNRHNDLVGCMVFRPIKELLTEDVWEFLAEHTPPWGRLTQGPYITLPERIGRRVPRRDSEVGRAFMRHELVSFWLLDVYGR